jgi:hypothetical protein
MASGLYSRAKPIPRKYRRDDQPSGCGADGTVLRSLVVAVAGWWLFFCHEVIRRDEKKKNRTTTTRLLVVRCSFFVVLVGIAQ